MFKSSHGTRTKFFERGRGLGSPALFCPGGIVALPSSPVVLIVPVPGVCAGKFGLFCRRPAGRFLGLACNTGRSDFYPRFGNGKVGCGSVVAHSINLAILWALLGQLVQCAPQGLVVGVDAGKFTMVSISYFVSSMYASIKEDSVSAPRLPCGLPRPSLPPFGGPRPLPLFHSDLPSRHQGFCGPLRLQCP